MIATSTERKFSFSPFFRSFVRAKQPTLLLDYDGTLAPFREQRNQAVPYDGVAEALDEILSQTSTRVVVVSGRAARQIPLLLGMRLALEIWGSHGMERLMPDGEYLVQEPSPRIAAAFNRAADQLEARGLCDRMEMKPGSLAVHWRGLDADVAGEACTTALRIIQPIAFSDGLAVVHFDGGIEMRVRTPNKGDVIKAILKEQRADDPIAYLGDDVTDEDAFRALDPRGLTILVRQEYRATSARHWISPPEELMAFLERWLRACGGEYDSE
jgi:trehalose 6-phosphate phosphatase